MFREGTVEAPNRRTPVRPGAGATRRTRRAAPFVAVLGVGLAGSVGLTACSSNATPSTTGAVNAIGAENQYADVLRQIGGSDVHVSSILNNPNTDPHSFESSPSVAQQVSAADLVVRNGVGYDDWVQKIESASPRASRHDIDVQHVLGLSDSTANPHLWYDPATMPKVASAIADALSALRPARAASFRAN